MFSFSFFFLLPSSIDVWGGEGFAGEAHGREGLWQEGLCCGGVPHDGGHGESLGTRVREGGLEAFLL